MADASVLSSLESRSDFLLQCPLCSQLKTLKLLSCFHTFCAECLNDPFRRFKGLVARFKDQDDPDNEAHTAGCPTCKKPIIVPGKDAKNLPDVILPFRKVQKKCNCKEEDTTHICVVCSDFLGDICTRAHRVGKRTKHHEIKTIEEWQANGELQSFEHRSNGCCQNHKSREATFHCNTCNCSICNNCKQLKHHSIEHEVVDLEDKAREAQQQLAQKVDGIYKKAATIQDQIAICDEAESVQKEELKGKENEIKHISKTAMEDLERKFQEDKRDIEQKETAALQQCADLGAAGAQKVNLRRSHCISQEEKLWALVYDASEKYQTSSLANMVAFAETFKGDTTPFPDTTLPLTLPPAPSFDIAIKRHEAELIRGKIKDALNRSHDYDNRAFDTAWITQCQQFIDGQTNIPPGPAQPPDTSRPLDATTEVTFLRPADGVKLCAALGGHPDVTVVDYGAGAALVDGQEKVLACRVVLKDMEERDLEVAAGEKSSTGFLPADDSLYSAVAMYLGHRPSALIDARTMLELPDQKVADWSRDHACEPIIVSFSL